MTKIKFFNKYNIVPANAKKIGLFDTEGNLVKTFSLDSSLPRTNETPLYKFGVLSDIHQNPNSPADENLPDLSNALSVLSEDENVDCICIAGDITSDGCSNTTQLLKYAAAISADNIAPTYAIAGNHDSTQNGFTTAALDNWHSYTTNYVKQQYKGQQTPTLIYRPESTSKITFYFKKQIPGTEKYDYFIFLGMYKWAFGSSSTNAFLGEDLAFITDLLNGEAANARCFIFIHPFFPTRAGHFQKLYSSNAILGGTMLTDLQNICDAHPNTVWFSGHSHWKQYLADQDPVTDNYKGMYSNIWHEQEGNGGWTVHVASCAYPRDAHYDKSQNKWINDSHEAWTSEASEGTVVYVYEDYIDIRAISFKCAWRDETKDSGYVTHYQPNGIYRIPISAGYLNNISN